MKYLVFSFTLLIFIFAGGNDLYSSNCENFGCDTTFDGNTKSEKVSFDYGSTWSHDKKPKLDSYIISDTYQINEIIKYDIDEYYIFDICGVKINKKPTELDKGIYMILEKENNYVFKIMVTQ